MAATAKEYRHKVDKSMIPTCNIMGVEIAAINMDWLLKFTDQYKIGRAHV